MRYRVIYNGVSVSDTFGTKAAAFAELTYQTEYDKRHNQQSNGRVQFQDPDTKEWFYVGVR